MANFFSLNFIADGIIYLCMAVLFIIALIKKDKTIILANLIATLGMIGTFMGIFFGLRNFDAQNITASIPELLSGMKTAFLTSLWGMGISLGLKLKNSFKTEEDDLDVNSTDELIKKQTQQLNHIANILEKLNNYSSNTNSYLYNIDNNLSSNLEKLVNYTYTINSFLTNINTSISTNLSYSKNMVASLEKISGQQENIENSISEILENILSNNENMEKIVNSSNKASEDLAKINNILPTSLEKITNYSQNSTLHLHNISDSITKVESQQKEVENNIINSISSLSPQLLDVNNNLKENSRLQEENNSIVKEGLINIDANQDKLNSAIENYAKKSDINMEDLINGLNTFAEKTDKHNSELIIEFRDFAKTMAENNNKAFIQALNESMKDLNNQLTEQFGENFKELNRAVFKLVEWQDNYKNTVIETTENQKVIFEGIEKAKDNLNIFANTGIEVVAIAENLNDLILNTNKQSEILNGHLTSMVELNRTATELIPNLISINNRIDEDIEIFKNSLDEVTTGISNSTIELARMSEEVTKESKNMTNLYLENIDKVNQENIEIFKNSLDGITAGISNSTIELARMSEEVTKESKNAINLYSENMNQAIQEAISFIKQINTTLEAEGIEITTKTSNQIATLNEELAEVLKNNVNNINKALEVALNQSLTSLGSQLATLSNKFVEDYEPLTDKLRDIVNMSRGTK